MFERERRAYQALKQCQCAHIVDYYGSFIQQQANRQEIRSLLLEYVDGLNLQEFFYQVRPPTNRQELLNLWGGFVGLFEALHHIYNHKIAV